MSVNQQLNFTALFDLLPENGFSWRPFNKSHRNAESNCTVCTPKLGRRTGRLNSFTGIALEHTFEIKHLDVSCLFTWFNWTACLGILNFSLFHQLSVPASRSALQFFTVYHTVNYSVNCLRNRESTSIDPRHLEVPLLGKVSIFKCQNSCFDFKCFSFKYLDRSQMFWF